MLAPCDRRSLVAPTAAALKKGARVVIIDSGLEESPDVQTSDNRFASMYISFYSPDMDQNQITDYLTRGGGLIIFPGDKTNAAFYNDVLGKKLNLLPATLGAIRGDATHGAPASSW